MTPERPTGPGQSGDGKPAPVDTLRLRASMERLYEIYRDIALKADDVTVSRCPYKDARARCTANFSCRNQYFVKDPAARPVCAGSDKLDYRSAWESQVRARPSDTPSVRT